MKKKIILLLCLMALTAILSGCSSKNVDETELEKMMEIANHITCDEKGYKVPEEYKAQYLDNNVNERMCIKKNVKSREIKATFDISGQEPILIKAEQYNLGVRIISIIIGGSAVLTGITAFCAWIKEK